MATKEERIKEKRDRAIALSKGTSGEPTTSEATYRIDLSQALSYYSAHVESKTKKKWVLEYLSKTERKSLASKLQDSGEHHFLQIGVLVRLKNRGQYISKEHDELIETKILEVLRMQAEEEMKLSQTEDKKDDAKPQVDRARITALSLCHQIDDRIDEFTLEKKSSFSVKNFLETNNVTAPVAKIIAEQYRSLKDELDEALEGQDEQLNEGYGYLTKSELKRFNQFVTDIIQACTQQKVIARKPRVKKEKPAGVLVSKMKFQLSYDELNLKSANPVSVVGATELLVYNTKYRRITVYRAMEGEKLSVKGTTIINYDVNRSLTQGLRKPEEFFKKDYSTRKNLQSAISTLTTKSSIPNGRINEDTIIVKVY